MKRIANYVCLVGVFSFVSWLFGPAATATLLLEEHFNYTTGTLLNGQVAPNGNTWADQGTNPDDATIAAGSLSYPNLASIGNSVAMGGGGDEPIIAFTGQTAAGTTVYYSFLLNVDSVGSLDATDNSNKRLANFTRTDSSSTVASSLFIRLGSVANTFDLGLGWNTAATPVAGWTTGDLALDTTYLVVAAYEIVAGANNDRIRFWLNPASLGGAEPSATLSFDNFSGSGLSDIGVGVGQGIGQFMWLQNETAAHRPAAWSVDHLRIGTTWADVTAMVPEPSTVLLLTVGGALLYRRRRRVANAKLARSATGQ